MKDEDKLRDMLSRIRVDTLYPSISEREHPLQRRIKEGAKLAVQQMEYVRLMEDRMKDVEKRLKSIENKGVEPEPPAPPGKTNQPRDMIVGIKRMTWQEYLPTDPNATNKLTDPFTAVQHKRRHEFAGQLPYHLIDVVTSGMNQPERLGKEQISKPATGPLDPAAPGPTTADQDSAIDDLPSVQPDRIRINSTLLLRALMKITKTHFSLARFDNESTLQDQVILKPFKVFVAFEQEIRDEIDRLEKLHNRDTNHSESEAPETAGIQGQTPLTPPSTDSNVPLDMPVSSSRKDSAGSIGDESKNATMDASVDVKENESSSLESRRCFEELKVLRELLDKDLKRTFELRRQIKDGSARSIAFQDLWHLFPLGSEIVTNSSNGQSQTYRVLNVSGGRPFLCTRYEVDMEPLDPFSSGREVPKFDILSYFYDSDGKELGACQQLHTIKSYEGTKAITSLPCFPIIYSKQHRGVKTRDFFIERGKRVLELTRNTDVVHKRYNGLTLGIDELREEVRQSLRIARVTY